MAVNGKKWKRRHRKGNRGPQLVSASPQYQSDLYTCIDCGRHFRRFRRKDPARLTIHKPQAGEEPAARVRCADCVAARFNRRHRVVHPEHPARMPWQRGFQGEIH